MTSVKNMSTGLIIGVITLVLALLSFSSLTYAQDSEEGATPEPTTTQEESTEENSDQENTSSFSYVAQPGDSYSLMARKAVQTYGINSSVNLSGAQIIYTETNLTNEAGSPVLVLGGNVSISEDSVEKWVNSAQELTDSQQAAWQVYVAGANFNTNDVGEASN